MIKMAKKNWTNRKESDSGCLTAGRRGPVQRNATSQAASGCWSMLLVVVAAAACYGEEQPELHIPIPGGAAVTLGPPGCPVVVVGNHVWHLKKNKIVRSLEGKIGQQPLRTLSGNGQYLAVADKPPNEKNTSVQVWDLAAEKLVFTADGKADRYLDVVAFVENKQLLLGGPGSNELDIWDVETGKKARTISVP